MGWNTAALYVRDRSVDDIVDTLPDFVKYVPRDESATMEEATSALADDRIYLAKAGGWCQLWDPHGRIVLEIAGRLDRGELPALTGTRALAVLFSSVAGMYAFWLFDDRELVRRVLFQDGQIAEDPTPVGDPLPVEARIPIPSWGPDEDFLFAVVKDVTGLDAVFAPEYRGYDLA